VVEAYLGERYAMRMRERRGESHGAPDA
jgi:hypothetical protein